MLAAQLLLEAPASSTGDGWGDDKRCARKDQVSLPLGHFLHALAMLLAMLLAMSLAMLLAMQHGHVPVSGLSFPPYKGRQALYATIFYCCCARELENELRQLPGGHPERVGLQGRLADLEKRLTLLMEQGVQSLRGAFSPAA